MWQCTPLRWVWLPASAQPMDINMVSGRSPGHRHLDGLWWQHRHRHQHRPQLQTWPSVAAWAQTSPWLQVVIQALPICLFLTTSVSPVPLFPQCMNGPASFSLLSPPCTPSFPSLHNMFSHHLSQGGHLGGFWPPRAVGLGLPLSFLPRG